jgi:hypothetical protein
MFMVAAAQTSKPFSLLGTRSQVPAKIQAAYQARESMQEARYHTREIVLQLRRRNGLRYHRPSLPAAASPITGDESIMTDLRWSHGTGTSESTASDPPPDSFHLISYLSFTAQLLDLPSSHLFSQPKACCCRLNGPIDPPDRRTKGPLG